VHVSSLIDKPTVPADRSCAHRVQRGRGSSFAHHGELLQGAFACDGRIRRGLVTLPCRSLGSTAELTMRPGARSVTVRPQWKTKARRAIELMLDRLELSGNVEVELTTNIAPSRGLGSSTSDVTAAIRALLDATGRELPAESIARVAVAAEVASDSVMVDRTVLFAHREGTILEEFKGGLPAIEVLGFSTSEGPSGVDTLKLPPARYAPWEIEAFSALRGMLRYALAHSDVATLGAVATASARLNQRHLPVPGFDALERIGGDVGAAGLQLAHSGDVGGFLFDRRDPRLEQRIGAARRRLSSCRVASSWRFSAGVA
jgi:uncharacterized protein involved in propanediol utilization